MLKRNHKFITLSLIATILLASLSPALTQNVSAEIADSKLISQPALNSQDLDKQVCVITKIQESVSNLGTPGLTNADFEALVKCGSQAIPALEMKLNSCNSDVRASAAYTLGNISKSSYKDHLTVVPIIRKYEELEKNPDVLRILQSYTRLSCINCGDVYTYKQAVQTQVRASSPIICSLPGIQKIFPRCK